MTKPFLITGCGRSGTRYMSDVLTAVGIPTGWETAVNPFTPERRASSYTFTLRKLGLRGDSNWLAVPYLRRIPRDVLVFHQVRHPLAVIRSFLALRFFGDDYLKLGPRADRRHLHLVYGNLPGLACQPTAITKAMDYWWRWNTLCEMRAIVGGFWHRLQRLEDILDAEQGTVRGTFLAEFMKAIHAPPPPELWEPPPNVNVMIMPGEGRKLRWGDLPDGAPKDKVRTLAAAYGYTTTDDSPFVVKPTASEVCS